MFNLASETIRQLLMFSGEALVVAILLLGLFRLRTYVGLSLLYVTLGVFQPIQVFLAASVYAEIFPGMLVSPGSAVLFTASLFTILLVYIREDAVEAGKVIYGIMAANLTLTFLLVIFGGQLTVPGTLNFLSLPRELFHQGARVMLAGSVALFIDVLLVIIVFEAVGRILPRSLFVRIYLTMAIILVIDTLVFTTGAFWGQENYAVLVQSGIVGKVAMAAFYSASLSLYLHFVEPADKTLVSEGTTLRDIFHMLTYRQKYERERADKAIAIQKSEMKFRQVIEQSVDGICITDEGGTIIAWNRSLEGITGLSASLTIGKPLWEARFMMAHETVQTAETLRIMKEQVLQLLQTGQVPQPEKHCQHEYLHPDGSKLYLQEVSFPIETAEGFMLGCIFHDITAKKNAEDQLQIHRDHLEALVDQRTAEITEKNQELEQFNSLFIDREFRIKELKDQVEALNRYKKRKETHDNEREHPE